MIFLELRLRSLAICAFEVAAIRAIEVAATRATENTTIGVSQKGSRERCLPVFFLKMKRKKTEESGKKRKKTEKDGKKTRKTLLRNPDTIVLENVFR